MGKVKKSSKTQALIETSPSLQLHATQDELHAMGKSLRDKCPRDAHAAWKAPNDRPDPISLMQQADKGRIPQLIPVRHGRMLKSPFTFYRGAALNMAMDLAGAPATGIRVQACGDAHLLNFGAYATPERRVVFDVVDLDETLPAPWEWDVKRLAASFVLACRDNGFSEDTARDAALSCVRSYRERMAEYSTMHVLDLWYASIDAENVMATIQDEETRKRIQKRLAKARQRSVLEHEFPELATTTGLGQAIKDNPPLIFHWQEQGHEEHTANLQKAFARYRETLQEDRRLLLDRFKLKDMAMKVVGVGSVGTACAIILMMASENDPLFLQVKQASSSVLEPYVGKSLHANHGQRVVHGIRMMQSASDIFLGWTEGDLGRHFYIRQLKDMKIKPMVEVFTPSVMRSYAEVCGWTLAHAHARSGEPAKISGYLGKSDAFDEAIADFSIAYADQSERDHEALMKAVRAGRLKFSLSRKCEWKAAGMSDETPNSVDPRVPLARERTSMASFRTQLALDRTTLAWIRTTLTMATFGFGLVAFFRSLRVQAPGAATVRLNEAAIRFGLGLILLGIASTVLAGLSHWLTVRRLRRGQLPVLSQWPLSITVAMLLAIIGLAGLWAIFTEAD